MIESSTRLPYRTAKRCLDILVSCVGLAVSSPILLLVGLAVRMTSSGPAIFKQQRVGKNGVKFKCWKIRTMYVDTFDVPTHVVSQSSITPIGRFLRRLKIDEIPQLVNVLKGDMSLVGPRPCLINQDQLILERKKLGVFEVRPGITGLAQVLGIDMSHPKLLSHIDQSYVNNMTITLDFKILITTVAPFIKRFLF